MSVRPGTIGSAVLLAAAGIAACALIPTPLLKRTKISDEEYPPAALTDTVELASPAALAPACVSDASRALRKGPKSAAKVDSNRRDSKHSTTSGRCLRAQRLRRAFRNSVPMPSVPLRC